MVGRPVRELGRMGKRIVLAMGDSHFVVIHLMVAGRLHWRKRGVKPAARRDLAAWDFARGTLVMSEAGTKHRASIICIDQESALRALDPGGVELSSLSPAAFEARIRSGNHTLERALTDPRIFAGIGNAYSDEILHRARLSPIQLTHKLTGLEVEALRHAALEVLAEWTSRLRQEVAGAFPERVTAFRPEMAVHGKFGQPCPVCGTKAQRIRYGENETNYCPACQTGGRLLADRSLSRLLEADWPRNRDEWKQHLSAARSVPGNDPASGRTSPNESH